MSVYFRHYTNKYEKRYIKRLVTFSNGILFPKLENTEKYRVTFYKNLNMSREEHAYIDIVGKRIDPRKFHINVKQINNIELLTKTVFHEMVHLKQFYRNELLDIPEEDRYIWHGEFYTGDSDNYWLLPWEIEAYGFEMGMFNIFRERYNIPKHLFRLDYLSLLDRMDEYDGE